MNENQIRLFKRCPQWGTFRPGSVKCEGYRHAIGAENGLRGLARLGYFARGWQGQGIVYQMTEEGRAARAALLVSPAPVNPVCVTP